MKNRKQKAESGKQKSRQPASLTVGDLRITELANGDFFLVRLTGANAGEGMRTKAANLARVMERFYQKEF